MKKKICFISAGLETGGMERSLTSLANYYADEGHQVVILSLYFTTVNFNLNPSIQIIWPKGLQLKPVLNRSFFQKIILLFYLVYYVRKNLNILKPDFVLCFGEWFNSFIILITRLTGIKLFISDRMGPNLKLPTIIDFSRRLLYKYADGIIAQTNYASQKIKKLTKCKNIVVIPNAVKFFDCYDGNIVRKKHIISVGRLSAEKDHATLIRAFALINDKSWTLQLIGDGVERNNLQQLVKSLNIDHLRVVFYGYQNDFNDMLCESEIFVLPSLMEGFPNALVEAMSVPLACISSNCIAGPSDIIIDGVNGLLFEPKNYKELAEKLNLLINDDEKRKSIQNQAYTIRETLPFNKIAEDYLKFMVQN